MQVTLAFVEKIVYRPGVAAIVRRQTGEILICERNDIAGAWQFPQGGIQSGESPLKALTRELREEISLRPTDYSIADEKGPYRYRFPGGMMKKGAHGQEQTYFLLDLLAEESVIRVDTEVPEFRRIRWVHPAHFDLRLVPPMKLDVYRAVLHDFFGV